MTYTKRITYFIISICSFLLVIFVVKYISALGIPIAYAFVFLLPSIISGFFFFYAAFHNRVYFLKDGTLYQKKFRQKYGCIDLQEITYIQEIRYGFLFYQLVLGTEIKKFSICSVFCDNYNGIKNELYKVSLNAEIKKSIKSNRIGINFILVIGIMFSIVFMADNLYEYKLFNEDRIEIRSFISKVKVNKHYKFLNLQWSDYNGLVFQIDADNLESLEKLEKILLNNEVSIWVVKSQYFKKISRNQKFNFFDYLFDERYQIQVYSVSFKNKPIYKHQIRLNEYKPIIMVALLLLGNILYTIWKSVNP